MGKLARLFPRDFRLTLHDQFGRDDLERITGRQLPPANDPEFDGRREGASRSRTDRLLGLHDI
jgi:hypothetical protein